MCINLKPKKEYQVKGKDGKIFVIPKTAFHETISDKSRLIWLLITSNLWREALFAIIKDWAKLQDQKEDQ